MSMTTREECQRRDAADPLARVRDYFLLPEGIIYLLGNSLGPLSIPSAQRVKHALDVEWGEQLLRSWPDGWWDLPVALGRRLARLIGARPEEVLVTDSTSVDIFKLVVAAARLRPNRRVIVTYENNFPTDLYILDEAAALTGLEVRRAKDRGALIEALDESVALIELTHVDYRTAEMAPMVEITKAAHDAGALVIWDLAHSIGAVPVDLSAADADFAVGCTYKYLNGGPGAPAFVFAAARLHDELHQPLTGWHGHARPFGFEPTYEPASGIRRFSTGSPPILSYAALDGALDVFEAVDLGALFEKSRTLSQLLIDRLEPLFSSGRLELGSPRDVMVRGSHLALRHANAGAIVAQLEAQGVLTDFRDPDYIRLGLAPLFVRYADVFDAADAITKIVGAA